MTETACIVRGSSLWISHERRGAGLMINSDTYTEGAYFRKYIQHVVNYSYVFRQTYSPY